MAAVLTESDAVKAVVTGGSAEMVHLSFPIEKRQDTETVNPLDGTPDLILWGRATDGTLDSDLQIVDPEWSMKALQEWFATKGNVRGQHDAKWPVGKGIEIDGHYVKSLICDPKAKHFIRNGVLNDYSIGIINPDVRRGDPRFRHLDPQGKAVNGVITGRPDGQSRIGELTICDRGANYGSSFSLVKAADDGTPEWTGTWETEPPAEPEQVKVPKGVTLTLPKDVSVTMKPSDLAKLATFRQQLVRQTAAIKTAAPAVVNKTAEPDAEKARLRDSEREGMPSGDFAYVDSQGGKHLPVHDEGHIRSALGRFAQQHFESPAARRKAAKKIVSRARGMGMDLSEHGNVVEAAGGKAAKAAAAVPDVTKCMKCQGTGEADGKPCPDCDEGKKAASAAAALDAALTAPLETAEKKHKVMCGHCGAIQNIKHAHCPECGNTLHPGAVPVPKKVKKNHDFACLGCGRDLDKGEKYCAGCGKENPGYLEVADHKIPANEDKAAKEHVSSEPDVTKARKNKKAGKKGKKNPFGGKQAPAFGKPDDDGKPADDEKAAAPDVAKRKGKGRDPGKGVKGREGAQGTTGLPPHREPDGPAVEAFEQDSATSDGDCEMKTALRHKSAIAAYGITPADAVLHDLTCPAFSPAMTGRHMPGRTLAGIDTQQWQAKALAAASGENIHDAVTRYNEMSALSRAAVTLKTADPDTMYRIAQSAYDAFTDANKAFRDATPGPGSAPTPGHVVPGTFRRPYISAGHAAPSPQYEGARTFPVPDQHPEAQDFQRGYLSAGHGSESPANSGPAAPMPETGTGQASRAGGAMAMQARDYESARNAMHDHLSRIAPGMCPMSPEPPGTQKPAPQVPDTVGRPAPHAAGKTAASKAEKAAARAERRAAAAKARARKARAAARVQRRIDKAVAAGIAKQAQQPETAAEPPVTEGSQMTPEAFAAAVKAATAPMAKQIRAQDKTLRKQGKVLDAIASQPDTTGAPYRGAGTAANKTSATAAPPRTPAEAAALAQTGYLQRLRDDWRNSPNPEVREAAWKELNAQLGLNPMTGNNDPHANPFMNT